MEMNSYFIGVSMTHEAWVILDAKETPFAPKAISLTHGQKPEKIFQTAVFQVCQDGKSWENVFTFASYKRENQTEIYLIDRDLSAYRFFRLLFLTAPGEEVELRNFKVCDYVPTEYMSSEVRGGRPSIAIPYVELEVEGFPEEDANGIYLPNVEEFPVLQSYSNGKGWELKEDQSQNLFYIEKRVQVPVLDEETGEPVLDEETGEPVMEEVVERKYTTEYTCSTPCTEEATYPERIQWEELPKAETPGYFRPFYVWSREFVENTTNEQFRVLPSIRQISHTQIEFRDESNQTWHLRKTQGTTEGEGGEIYGALEDPLVEDVLRTHGPYLYYKGDSGKKLPFWFFSPSPDRYPGNLYFPDGQKGTLPIGGTGTWKVTGSSSFSSRIYASSKEMEKIPSWTILKVSGFLKENMEEDERINGYYILEEPVTAFKGTKDNPKFRWEIEGQGEIIGRHTDSGVYLFRRSDGVYAFSDEGGNPLHGELISETSSSLTGKWGEEDRDGRIDWVPPYSNNLNRAYMIYGAGVGKDGLYFPRGSEGVWSNGAWDMQLVKNQENNNYYIPFNRRLSFRKTNGYPEFSETVTIDRYCTPSDCLTLVAEKTKINNEDKDYLTFTALESAIISSEQIGNPSVAGLMYSVNGEKFKPYKVGQNIHLNTGSHVRFYNFYGSLSTSSLNYFHFLIDGEVAASGNILSLLDHIGPEETLPNCCFYRLFADQIDLRTAPQLPSLNLSTSCYAYMFSGTGIYSSPHLPAKHLAPGSYEGIFKNAPHLQEVSCEFEGWGTGATTDWLEGVSPTGTFQISDYVPIRFGEDYFLYDWEFPNEAVIRGNKATFGGVVFEYNSSSVGGGDHSLSILRDRIEYSNQNRSHNDLYYRKEGEEYAVQYRGETIYLKQGEIVYLNGPVNKYGSPYGPYANIRVNNLLISGDVLSLSRDRNSVAAGEFAELFAGNTRLFFKTESKLYESYDFYANLETFSYPSYSDHWGGLKEVSTFLSNMQTIGENGCKEMFKGVKYGLDSMEMNLESVDTNGVMDMFNSTSVDASTITLGGAGDFSYMFRNSRMKNGISPKIVANENSSFVGLFESGGTNGETLSIFIKLQLLRKVAEDNYLKDAKCDSVEFYVSNVSRWYDLGYAGTTEDGSYYREYNSTITYAVWEYPNSQNVGSSGMAAPNLNYWPIIVNGGGGIYQE